MSKNRMMSSTTRLLAVPSMALVMLAAASASLAETTFKASLDSAGLPRVEFEGKTLLRNIRLEIENAGAVFDQTIANDTLVSRAGGSLSIQGTILHAKFTAAFAQSLRSSPHGLIITNHTGVSNPRLVESLSFTADIPSGSAWVAEGRICRCPAQAGFAWITIAPGANAEIRRNGPRTQLVLRAAAVGEQSVRLAMHLSKEKPTLPLVANLAANAPAIPQFEKFELTADVWAEYENPYDPEDISVEAQFTAPSGRITRVAGFLYQGFQRSRIFEAGKPVERLSPDGGRVWKVRFAPIEAGVHRYTLRVATRQGASREHSGHFECIRSKNPGFLRVDQQSRRYFRFSTGEPYFAIGHNVCWVTREGGTYEYEAYFNKMRAAGENYTRIWLCSWGMQLEGLKLDSYRLDDAWRLDAVFELARENGIYINFCLDNFHDWRSYDKRESIPYFSENGGPAETISDFFTHELALKHYLRRLRYIIARWGYSTHVMAWELWNEMNYLTWESEPDYMIDWCKRVAVFIRRTDPNRHLVTTSLGADALWQKLWEMEEMDFAQYHTYLSSESWMASTEEHDAVGYITDATAKLEVFGKPYLLAEWGFHGSNEHNPLNARDRFGLHLHDAIWATSLSGAAGTAMPWWWDNYIGPNDLYYRYAAFSKFAKGIDWTGQPWKRIQLDVDEETRVIGMMSHKQTLLWIQNPKNTWYDRLVAGTPAPMLKEKTLTISPFPAGRYRVEWWDTTLGGAITHHETKVDDRIVLSLPKSGPDIACKITLLGR